MHTRVMVDDRVAQTLGFDSAISRLSDFVFDAHLALVEANVEAGISSFQARALTGDGDSVKCIFSVVRAGSVRAVNVERATPQFGDGVSFDAGFLAEVQELLQAVVVLVGVEENNETRIVAWVQNSEALPVEQLTGCQGLSRMMLNQERLVIPSGAADRHPDETVLARLGISSLCGLSLVDESVNGFVMALFDADLSNADHTVSLMSLCAKVVASELARLSATAELAWANERFRIAVSAANIGVWDYDFSSESVTVEGNESSRYKQDPAEPRGWGKTIHPDDAARVKATFQASVETGEDFRCKMRVIDNGKTRYLESFGRPVVRDGRPIRMVGAHVDVTDQTMAERKAVEQTYRLQLALDSAGMGSWEWDLETDTLSASASVLDTQSERFHGTRESVLQRIPDEERHMVRKWLDMCLAGEGFEGISHRVIVDGEERWLEVRGARIEDEVANKIRVMGLVWDVTERRDDLARLAIAEAELRRSNERFTMAAEAAGVGLWEVDLETLDLKWDAHMAKMFCAQGATSEAFQAAWFERVHPEDLDRVNCDVTNAFADQRSSVQFRIVLPSGDVRHMQSFVRFVDGEGGQKLIGLCMDVTVERVTELRERHGNRVLEALISSASVEEVLEALVRAIESEIPKVRVGFMLVGPTGDKLLNGAAPSMPVDYLDAVDGVAIAEGNGSCGSSAALRIPVIVEDCQVHRYWQDFRDLASAADFRGCWSIPIMGGDNTIFGTLGAYFRNPQPADDSLMRRLVEAADFASLAISRRRAETELRDREILLQTTGEIAKVAGWELDVQTGRRKWTEQMYRLHGMELNSKVDHAEVVALYSPEARLAIEALMAKTLKDGSAQDAVLEMTSKDGVHRWLRVAGRTEFENGVPVKLIGAAQDVTAEREAAMERERLQEQLLHAQKMESVGRLAGGVAHDFNNILSVILGHAELALDELPQGSVVAADLDEIRVAAERSASLTRQLLAFARKQPIAPAYININSTISEMVNMLRRLIGERIALMWEADPGLWDVFVDPTQIDQILANLCVNARDAISGDGRVVIRTENRLLGEAETRALGDCEPGAYVMVSVSDTGVGIPSELLEHVFEPFFTTKPVGAGTGLGLATVYGIVKQNGGGIRVTSQEGEGTTFEIFFPRQIGEVGEESSSPVWEQVESHTILLVEDEPSLLRLAKRMLEGMGHKVLPAATPMEAIELARQPGKIDILISDVIMPGMNGRELADALDEFRPELRHIFMSGYTAEVIELEGILDSGEFFLQKPFTLKEFDRTIRLCLGNAD